MEELLLSISQRFLLMSAIERWRPEKSKFLEDPVELNEDLCPVALAKRKDI
jgi:hypothetical protein